MEDIIKLHSRGDINNYLKKMKRLNGEESKTYVIKTDIPILKTGYVEETRKFIDLSEGPMIVEGLLLEEANAVVKSIDFIVGYGYTITFE